MCIYSGSVRVDILYLLDSFTHTRILRTGTKNASPFTVDESQNLRQSRASSYYNFEVLPTHSVRPHHTTFDVSNRTLFTCVRLMETCVSSRSSRIDSFSTLVSWRCVKSRRMDTVSRRTIGFGRNVLSIDGIDSCHLNSRTATIPNKVRSSWANHTSWYCKVGTGEEVDRPQWCKARQ